MKILLESSWHSIRPMQRKTKEKCRNSQDVRHSNDSSLFVMYECEIFKMRAQILYALWMLEYIIIWRCFCRAISGRRSRDSIEIAREEKRRMTWRSNELLVYDDQIDMHVLLCYVDAAKLKSVKQCRFMTKKNFFSANSCYILLMILLDNDIEISMENLNWPIFRANHTLCAFTFLTPAYRLFYSNVRCHPWNISVAYPWYVI